MAKVNAAKETLGLLLPDCRKALKIDSPETDGDKPDDGDGDTDIKAFFDSVDIEDLRVAKMSQTYGQPPPYQILSTFMQKNYGLGKFNVETDLVKEPNRKHIKYTMKVCG